MNAQALLEVRSLNVSYRQGNRFVPALRDISLTLRPGEAYGIIGESGSGKSTLAYAIMRHLGTNGRIDSGSVLFKGQDILRKSEQEMRGLRGDRIAMVYQQPQAALNPSIPLGDQIAEVFITHTKASKREAHERALHMLEQVRIHDPAGTARLYPHQASGGMQQRVVIAMALALRPDLIILDEPTTALDVTTQAAVLELLEALRQETGTSLIFIAHDLAVITRICDRIAVCYAGEMLEEAGLRDLFHSPNHPYTAGLLECLPARGVASARQPLTPIPGRLPRLSALPPGCIYQPRCRYAQSDCTQAHPELFATGADHRARCFHWQEVHVATPTVAGSVATPAAIPPQTNGVTTPPTGANGATLSVGNSGAPGANGASLPAIGEGAAPLLEVTDIVKSFQRPGLRGVGRGFRLPLGRERGPAPLSAEAVRTETDAAIPLDPAEPEHHARVLNAISLSLSDGATVGLVGESGSGKTTLARCILGLTPADGGRMRFGVRDLPYKIGDRDTEMLRQLQMVFQNPDMSLNPRQTVRTVLVRPIRLLNKLGRRQAEAAARELLRAVNLDDGYMDRYPSQLSGGEKQRVAIARAFATRTKLVICDEPVSGLDVSVQATVLNLLQELQARWGTAYLFISHDLQVVQYLADRIVVMYRGNIVETGTTDQVFTGPNHPYTELLLSSIPLPDPDAPKVRLALQSEIKAETADDGRGCPFKGRCHRKLGAICDTEFPPLRTIDSGHLSLCHIPVEDLPYPPTTSAARAAATEAISG